MKETFDIPVPGVLGVKVKVSVMSVCQYDGGGLQSMTLIVLRIFHIHRDVKITW